MSCFCKNLETTSGPKVKDTPRSFSDHPVISLSGSDHSRSHNSPGRTRHIMKGKSLGLACTDAPVSGTSVGLMTLRICSMDWRSGLRPPCIVKIFSSMMAAMGRQLKQSVNVFHSLMLYRRLPGVRRIQISAPTVTRDTYIRRRNRRYG